MVAKRIRKHWTDRVAPRLDVLQHTLRILREQAAALPMNMLRKIVEERVRCYKRREAALRAMLIEKGWRGCRG